jgi:glycerol-3-phosphate acyltransferase PlsY
MLDQEAREFDGTRGSAGTRGSHVWLIPAIAATGFTAAALLWWRFGESVFLTSMMGAIIACF